MAKRKPQKSRPSQDSAVHDENHDPVHLHSGGITKVPRRFPALKKSPTTSQHPFKAFLKSKNGQVIVGVLIFGISIMLVGFPDFSDEKKPVSQRSIPQRSFEKVEPLSLAKRMGKRFLGINWQLFPKSGWGVKGIQLVRYLRTLPIPDNSGDHWYPVFLTPPHPDIWEDETVDTDALHLLVTEQKSLMEEIQRLPFDPKTKQKSVPFPVVHSVGGAFQLHPQLWGTQNIGVVVFENSHYLTEEALERAREYTLLVTPSQWNARALINAGIRNVEVVHEGIDETMWKPLSSSEMLKKKQSFLKGRIPDDLLSRDPYVIFSGGKMEIRKSQDIVAASVQRYLRKNKDAEVVLVTAWQSGYPKLSEQMITSPYVKTNPTIDENTKYIDVKGWLHSNFGIEPDHVVDVGFAPQNVLTDAMHAADVAIFPNRCEGATNLIAMQTIAAGIPTIISLNSGHLDLLTNPYTGQKYDKDNGKSIGIWGLQTQDPLKDTEGKVVEAWGESKVWEVIPALEEIYASRATTSRVNSILASNHIRETFTWKNSVSRMLRVMDAVNIR